MTEHAPAVDPNAVAVVGMAGRFPGARNVDELWANLRDGVESIRRHTEEELREAGVPEERIEDPDYVPATATLNDPERFDAGFFGYLPREAEMMDPQHRHFLECAWEALESAGYDPTRHPGRIGIFGGVARNTYLLEILRRDPEHLQRSEEYLGLITGEKDFAATRVGYKLDLRGPCVNVQTACSTSGIAIHLACQSLLTGESDMALAGGGRILVPLGHGYVHEEGGILSPDGRCRAFDADAQGTIRGSGMALVVLKRLVDALNDGDFVHAVIKATAVNNDGADKAGFTAPGVRGQADVVAEALAVAGVDADSIDYVEAHGTATAVGDPIEVAALTRAFRETTDRSGYCALGSVKTNVGHLDAGAAVTGLIKVALSLRNEAIPPSLHYREPNPQIDFDDSPFFVNAELRGWPRGEGPRRAGVSSFGLGGTNFHAVLEEAPRRDAPEDGFGEEEGPHLLVLSARTDDARREAEDRLASHVEARELPLDRVAWTLRHGRRPFARRTAVVAGEREDALRRLRGEEGEDEERFRVSATAPESGRAVAFLFPGGGSQHVAMGRGLYRAHPVYRTAMDECLAAIDEEVAREVRALVLERDPGSDAAREQAERPGIALPALFATEYAVARLLVSLGVGPDAVMGHSVGEYAAACLAGVFSVEDAVALVSLRGRLFEDLPPGAMTAVPLAGDEVRRMEIDGLSVAAENVPSACVASGSRDAVEELDRRLEERGMEGRRLHIDVAAHSDLVEPILQPFRQFVETLDIRPPELPFVSNVGGGWANGEDVADPEYWVRHLQETVRFAGGLETVFEWGPAALVEVGPGRTLASFARMNPGRGDHPVVTSMRHPTEDLPDDEVLLGAVGRLWAHGAKVDWEAFDRGVPPRRVPLPTYPFQGEHHWSPVLRESPVGAEIGASQEPRASPDGAPDGEEPASPVGEPDREPVPVSPTPLGDGRAVEEIIEEQIDTMHRQLQLLGVARERND